MRPSAAARRIGLAIAMSITIGTTASGQTLAERGYLFAEPRVSFTLLGGVALPSAGGDLWRYTFDDVTLQRSDFIAFDRGLDMAIRVGARTDLVLGFATNGQSRPSELRGYVGTDSLPIKQRTRFSRRPAGASLRYHMKERGRRIGTMSWFPARFVPWVGAGGGIVWYQFEQEGEFVDAGSLDVFFDRFTVRRSTAFLQLSAGGTWSLTPVIALSGELRAMRARGGLSRDFDGFDGLDLSGVSSFLGMTIRIPQEDP